MKKSRQNKIVENSAIWVLSIVSWLLWTTVAFWTKFDESFGDEWYFSIIWISSVIHIVLLLTAVAMLKVTYVDVEAKKVVVKSGYGCKKQEMLFEDIGCICLASTFAIRGLRNGIFVVNKDTWQDLKYESEPRHADEILHNAIAENKVIWVYHSVKNRSIVNLCGEHVMVELRRPETINYMDL